MTSMKTASGKDKKSKREVRGKGRFLGFRWTSTFVIMSFIIHLINSPDIKGQTAAATGSVVS